MSYLSDNFDAFQEGIINGGYDPQEQDNHPVAGGDEAEAEYFANSPLAQHNLELSEGFEPFYGYEDYEPNPYDGTYSEE